MRIKKLNIFVVVILFLLSSVELMAQTQLSVAESQRILAQITEASNKIETLQADFRQEKTSTLLTERAVATGVLMYQSPSMLRWEYTEPTPSTLILNGNEAALFDRNNQRIGNERMLAQLGSIIVSMINGSGIAQNRQFTSAFFEVENNGIVIVLTPVQRRLRDFYNNITLKIDAKTMLAEEITLNERSGDKTVISLTNIKLNQVVLPNSFATQ